MTYISRKTRLLVPQWFDECEPSYRYWVNRKRSDGRLKRHTSCDDLRAWVYDEYLKYQYFLEVMTDGENYQPFLGVIGRFIPVNAILDFLCGNAGAGKEKNESELEDQLQRQSSDKAFDPEDILRMLSSAMAKLESIQYIIHTGENDRSRDQDASACDESGSSNSGGGSTCLNHKKSLRCHNRSVSNPGSRASTVEEECTSEEDYKTECNETLKKISCLKEKLSAIQEQKELLKDEIEASQRTVVDCSQNSREEQMHRRKLQMKMEKFIDQKKPILNEMYQAVKHLNDLKKMREQGMKRRRNRRKKRSESLCCVSGGFQSSGDEKPSGMSGSFRKLSCLRKPHKNASEWNGRNPDARSTSVRAPDCKEESSNAEKAKSVLFDEKDITMLYQPRRKRSPKKKGGNCCCRNAEEVVSLSTDMISSESLTNKVSRGTYNVSSVVQLIPNKKSKSETTMAEIEQTLRNYGERLRNLDCLEDQIDTLKRKAVLASKFRDRWLSSCAKNRSQRAADIKKMSQLCADNSELRKALERIFTKWANEQMKMMRLRYKLSHMGQLIKGLKSKLNEYETMFNNQRDCICKLEETVSVQKDEIEKLMSRITRMCMVSKGLKETEKSAKRKVQKSSRAHGPGRAKSGKTAMLSTVTSSDEEMPGTSYYYCCNSTNSDCLMSRNGRRKSSQERSHSRGVCHCN